MRACRRSRAASPPEAASARGARTTLGGVPDLVLLRHGQSTWNAENLFTGWTDVDLTPLGEDEARQAGRLLLEEQDKGLDLRVLHTSVLTRAIRTANLALDELGRPWLPVRRHWRLNERHYGGLQGKNKKETTEEFGADQVKLWRRSLRHAAAAARPGRRAQRGGRPPLPQRARPRPSR